VGENSHYVIKPRAVVGSTGASERYLDFVNNDLPGVIGAGGVQTIMNEYGVKPGDSALVVGSGNVGLIVAYQLLQAGVAVRAVVEILPEIGGWFVHAAKVRRYGVPVLTQHTIKAVYGNGKVEEAEVVAVDENFNPIPGSEKKFRVDLVLLAVGLEPDTRLFSQCGAVMKWSPDLGGLVPLRTPDLETSVRNLYVAGDASGIEEATTAIMEGWVAALSAVSKLADKSRASRAEEELEKINKFLWEEYRASPVLARARRGKQSVTVSREEMEKIRAEHPPHVSFG
ncbi:MAG: NAD(P)/FAD-dependent oxidoreductase, partial [Sulfolobales archaeon]|nr:NAD(P)/FAD-dependent oxidoreductase [Sulfolobales archaeon]